MIYLLRRRALGKTSCEGISINSTTGIKVFRNDHTLPDADFVFRWGCTSNVEAKTVVNIAKAIHLVTNKRDFRMLLNENKLCPVTWMDPAFARFPCIVRRATHHQGRHLYLCYTIEELVAALQHCQSGFYISEYIDKTEEYRIFIVQGRVACVARKFPGNENQVAWNVYQGGRFENVRWDNWPLKAIKHSIQAFELSGLDFGGVDVMIDRNAEDYILEINSAPSLTSEYRQKCFAKAFDHIVQHGKVKIPLEKKLGGYTKFIHPAIHDGALI